LLKELADRAASSLSLPADRILSELLKRETLGSTGTGGGIAIPHARIPGLDKPFGILVRLRQPIDFNAIDSQPVDLLFLLLLPVTSDKEQPSLPPSPEYCKFGSVRSCVALVTARASFARSWAKSGE
jgi:PTS system nitrogen regulatory IIA component